MEHEPPRTLTIKWTEKKLDRCVHKEVQRLLCEKACEKAYEKGLAARARRKPSAAPKSSARNKMGCNG